MYYQTNIKTSINEDISFLQLSYGNFVSLEDYIILIENSTDNSTDILYNKDIKYIVTKEQFDAIKYEVE